MARTERIIPDLEFKPTATPLLFEIVELEELFSRPRQPNDHDPFKLHRLNFFAVLVNTGPTVTHQIDFTKVPLASHELLVIAKGQTHCFDATVPYRGYLVLFTEAFLQQQVLPSAMAVVNLLYHPHGESVNTC